MAHKLGSGFQAYLGGSKELKGSPIFEFFSSERPSELLVVSRAQWDKHRREQVTQEESRRMAQEVESQDIEEVMEEEDRQDWSTDYQEAAKKVLRYLDESETLPSQSKRSKGAAWSVRRSRSVHPADCQTGEK